MHGKPKASSQPKRLTAVVVLVVLFFALAVPLQGIGGAAIETGAFVVVLGIFWVAVSAARRRGNQYRTAALCG